MDSYNSEVTLKVSKYLILNQMVDIQYIRCSCIFEVSDGECIPRFNFFAMNIEKSSCLFFVARFLTSRLSLKIIL